MKAIIMAGGFGTRLRPLTINLPKPMAPVVSRPMMEHVVALLVKQGITDITSLLYFQPEKIKEYFGDGRDFGVNMRYVLPDEDYGTAGAVRFAVGDPDESVLVISGDLVTDFDLGEAIEWHQRKKADATILLTRLENPLAYGIVITDHDGRIVRFLEKPTWGEAFSDTINTGIYLLEPQAIQHIPKATNFDFSQNLFPLMLSREMGLYGKVMRGYWRDVGNVTEYNRVHSDFFNGKIGFELKFTREERDGAELFLGRDVKIHDSVEFSGRIVLGNGVTVDGKSHLHNCVIGDNSSVGHGAELTDSVIWDDSHIGAEVLMNNAVICTGARIGRSVQLLDNVIVSDGTTIGDSATVKANVRIWPGKTVDGGALVSTSMVWGEKWNRELFTDSKITGLALTEITPEMGVSLGAAFGAFIGKGNSVIVSRDGSDTARLLKRSMVSGILAAGANVSDLEALPVPVMRFELQKGKYAAGIYIRHNPEDYRLIDLIFFDGNGLDLPSSKVKKVERMYFGEDFERASLDDIGRLETPQLVIEQYRERFLATIDQDIIRDAGFKVIVDHSFGSSSDIFPELSSQLGISAVELNAAQNPRKFSMSDQEQAKSIEQLSTIVKSLHANVGFHINPAAEKLAVIDDEGSAIDNQVLLLLTTKLYLQTHSVKRIAVPVSASMGVEEIAREHGVQVTRVANDHLAMMEVFRRGDVDFVGGTRGGFIFPGFQTGSDAMVSAVKILEMLARTGSRLSELRREFERFDRRMTAVPCPWSKRGRVMRMLITNTESKNRQLIDGVRVIEDDGWVLVYPDRRTAMFNILAESTSSSQTDQLLDQYKAMVEESQAD
jgi:mannose-1-phosphate guanylyltransferase/phosphomannomutase